MDHEGFTASKCHQKFNDSGLCLLDRIPSASGILDTYAVGCEVYQKLQKVSITEPLALESCSWVAGRGWMWS